jgi:hypothetical protein
LIQDGEVDFHLWRVDKSFFEFTSYL